MALLTHHTSCLVQHMRGAGILSGRCPVISWSHKCLSHVSLPPALYFRLSQLSRKSSRDRFNVYPAIASAETQFRSYSSGNHSSLRNQQHNSRYGYCVAGGNSIQSSHPKRYSSTSPFVHTKAVSRGDVIDGPDDGGHLNQADHLHGPLVRGMGDTGRDPPRLSSLYIPRFYRERFVSTLSPHMNFQKAFADVNKLASELAKRKGYEEFSVGKLKQLYEGWEKFIELKSRVDKIDDRRFEMAKQKNAIIEQVKSSGSELEGEQKKLFDRLGLEIKEIGKTLKTLSPQLNQLELTVVYDLLRLPNTLDKNTPLLEDKVLFHLHETPTFDFPTKTHMELGGLNQTLELSDVAPGAFYLMGDLAQAELALQDLLKDQLCVHFKYLQQSNPDFGKGVTVEGCGFAIDDDSEVLRLKAHSAENEAKEFLTGGSSFPSFAGYFAKKAVIKTNKFLPQKLFTIGRLYAPRSIIDAKGACEADAAPRDLRDQTGFETSGTPSTEWNHGKRTNPHPDGQGILSSLQSTSVSAFVVDTKESNSEADVVNELLAVSTTVYAKLGLHFRIVQKHAESLKSFEKAAYSIEMMTTSCQRSENSPGSPSSVVDPSLDGNHEGRHPRSGRPVPLYTEVGRISVVGDYVSKRLLMLYDKKDVLGGGGSQQKIKGGTRFGFLNVVFCEMMNVSKYLAVMVENTQTEAGGYKIPSVLLEYPVMAGADGDGKKS